MQYPPDNQPQNEPSPQTGTSYPLYEIQPTYEQGYRPMPQPAPPMQPQWYSPQYPPQQYPMQPPQYYQQPMPYPQQQQMMYPQHMMPPQIVINNSMTQQTMMYRARTQQVHGLVRLLYFLFIGAWLGLLWLSIALALICTIIGAPIGFVMLNQLPAVLTLQRH